MRNVSKRAVLVFAVVALLVIGMLGPRASSALCQEDEWLPEYSGTTKDLYGVYALDSSHVWAVGMYGTILFFNGTEWSIQGNNDPDVIGTYLNGVSAADENHVWAVGAYGKILFFDGVEWSTQTSPTNNTLEGVAALDENHVWAVGSAGEIIFFDGTGWEKQATPTSKWLGDVSAADANHVWAAGHEGTIVSFDGNSWSEDASPTVNNLFGISAGDDSNVWAVGGNEEICYWNGTEWGLQDSGCSASINDVSAVDSNHAWAVTGSNQDDPYAIVFWDGDQWSPRASVEAADVHIFNGVSAIDADHAWAVGFGGVIFSLNAEGSTRKIYFPEGRTSDEFDEWLCLQNPGSSEIDIEATYMFPDGTNIERTHTIPATSRTTVNVNNEVGEDRDVSVQLAGMGEFYAERVMYFDYKRDVPGFGWPGGHCSKGISTLANDWYFAEGTTRDGFEEWICIQNPGENGTEVDVNYMIPGSEVIQKKYQVEPRSRHSVYVNGDVGAGKDVAVHVHCEDPIAVERPMYFDYDGKWKGGGNAVGSTSPRFEWYFAEGTTRSGFEEYLAVQNPYASIHGNLELTVQFLTADGETVEMSYQVGADPRWTLNVNDVLGPGVDAAVIIESNSPVVAERSMYFSYKDGEHGYPWTGGENTLGAEGCKSRWHLPEGCTRDNFDEYICIANPSDQDAAVTIRFMLEDGEVVDKDLSVSARQRVTVPVFYEVERGHDVSAEVSSDTPIIVERPMYFDYGGWAGGHNVIGF